MGKRKQPKGRRGVLVSILLMGNVLCVMLWMMVCGGCRTLGSGDRLPMPMPLSGQSGELKDINGRLYDYLQILLWVGRNNYDNYGCRGGQREGSGLGSCKPRNHDVGNHGSELKNKEVGLKALDGCLEIVGLPDGNEMILANNIDGEGVDRIVRDAMALKARKEKLVGRMGKDVALLEKRYASYESSHRTLRALRMFGGLVCTIIVVFGLIFFRLR